MCWFVAVVFVTCFGATNEASVLSRLAVLPDSVGLIGGETQPFTAEGFDEEVPQPLSIGVLLYGGFQGTDDQLGMVKGQFGLELGLHRHHAQLVEPEGLQPEWIDVCEIPEGGSSPQTESLMAAGS